MSQEVEKATAPSVTTEDPQGEDDLVTKILNEGRLARDETQIERGKALIAEFVQQIMQGQMVVSKDLEATINICIAAIDKKLTAQLNEIMHAEEFQKLEASWRGLHHLVFTSETSTELKIRVLNVSKEELGKDLARAKEFDQSALFKKVYEEEYGMFGGEPIGALIGDYEFSNHPQDIAMLEKISGIAAAAHAPFISAASPKLFGRDSFTEVMEVRDLAKIFDSVEYKTTWRSFRESEDSRYVGLCLPHTLMRPPYGEANEPTETFNFEEDVDGREHKKYLWGNAAYSFGTRLTEAFAKYRWCAAIRGVESGGRVQGLPTHTFLTDKGNVVQKCPTEIAIANRREKELSDLGFIPLVHCKDTDYAAFFAAQSCNTPPKYDKESANDNARLSTQLQYMFAVSRFAHYLNAMMLNKVGSFMTRQNTEDFLSRWISNYVLLDDNAGQELKAQYPLREARVEVTEVPGKPGVYKAVAFLKPHFQLDELAISLRLVAELPPPRQK